MTMRLSDRQHLSGQSDKTPTRLKQGGKPVKQQRCAVIIQTERLRTQCIDALILHRWQVRQQRISVKGRDIFVVAGKQEERFAV